MIWSESYTKYDGKTKQINLLYPDDGIAAGNL
jgi:hypothetical protein